jgi:hypothetical protein
MLRTLRALPNAWILFWLVVLVLAYPMLRELRGGHAAVALFDIALLLLALRAARTSGSELRLGVALLLPAMGLHIAAELGAANGIYLASLATQALFHAFVAVSLLRYMLRDEVMTLDELFAAASLYAIIAFVFAYLYTLLETLRPGAFYINPANNPDGLTDWWELLYFSFTCLTSVGFGEITPVSNHARSLVMLEQMLGVLYLALIISRLISLQKGRTPER